MSLVKKLSGAARLMADLQRDESLTRRSLLLATINSAQKETLELSAADEWVFGPKLGDRLRAAKVIEKSVRRVAKQKPRSEFQQEMEQHQPEQLEQEQQPVAASEFRKENVILGGRTTSTLEDRYPGGRQVIRKAFFLKGVPEESIDITLSSLCESSLKQYDCSLKKWWQFCRGRKLSLFHVEIPDILSFLTEQFDKGASYGSLNCICSAISLIIGSEIGKNQNIVRFFKGLAKLRPPESKYDSTWDPKIVLDYFKLFPNDQLSLVDLSKKLITLLALVTSQRVQTLSLINVSNIVFKESFVEIKIPSRIKTSKDLSGHHAPVLFARNKECERRHQWVKDVLNECGIDTNIFSAHSTRHAATSAAKRKGVNSDLIRKSAGWTTNSATFARFYDRPLVQDPRSFSRAILG
ncbi:uncharacterized protein LOC135171353 [Diachasmimorpha longicaudata]|uniref:uncharacterized protein LOC135171353 n=1 Tax=Diachasmimorpha longicaudata TaxID=58733 RepID=UPI0030B8CE95